MIVRSYTCQLFSADDLLFLSVDVPDLIVVCIALDGRMY